jgi:hypothetical protein
MAPPSWRPLQVHHGVVEGEGAGVGWPNNLPAVRACQVWGLGMQHRCRQLDECPPFCTPISGFGFGQGAHFPCPDGRVFH